MKNILLNIMGAFGLSLGTMFAATVDTPLFQDNFESGNLNQWTGALGGPHHGVIAVDPLQAGNHVLTFTALNAGGDIFTAATQSVADTNQQYLVRFDYLGVAQSGSVTGNLGGFLGFVSTNGTQYWIAGTDPSGINTPLGIELTDDGARHHYEIDITPLVRAAGLTDIHLALEDWTGSGGIAGDAHFDNVQLLARHQLTLEDIAPCSGPATGGTWRNHGQYVSTVTKETKKLVKQRVITQRERSAFITQAAHSDCGKKPRNHPQNHP